MRILLGESVPVEDVVLFFQITESIPELNGGHLVQKNQSPEVVLVHPYGTLFMIRVSLQSLIGEIETPLEEN